ncbi:MAG TPA: hypothetical protein VE991_04235 [Acidimicrobiales bacterium]|nr:hypothetical protein [Acidimicrobiales bacterium]
MPTESGWRTDVAGAVHDVDQNQVVFDFMTDGETCDSYGTAWAPHVFRDSFAKRAWIPMLLNHQDDRPAGRSLRCESLSDRARVVNRFANTDVGRRAREDILDGLYPGASFHFVRGVFERHPRQRGALRYRKADMLESSAVLYPSSSQFRISGVRSGASMLIVPDGADVDDYRRALDRAVRGGRRRELAEVHRQAAAAFAERVARLRSDDVEQDAFAARRGNLGPIIGRLDEHEALRARRFG